MEIVNLIVVGAVCLYRYEGLPSTGSVDEGHKPVLWGGYLVMRDYFALPSEWQVLNQSLD